MSKDRLSKILIIIISGIIPIYFLFTGKWSFINALLYFWIETMVMGIFSLIQMYMTKLDQPPFPDIKFAQNRFKISTKGDVVKEFLTFYFVFGFLEGVFILIISLIHKLPIDFGQKLIIALAIIVFVRLADFVFNFLLPKTYLILNPKQAQGETIGRLFILFLVVWLVTLFHVIPGIIYLGILLFIFLQLLFSTSKKVSTEINTVK